MPNEHKSSIRNKPHYNIITVLLIGCIASCGHARQRHNHISDDRLTENTITIIGSPNTDSTSVVVSNEEYDAILVPRFTYTVANQFLKRLAYIASYNRETRDPNWVAWKLTREHIDGPYPREGEPYYDEDGCAYGIGNVSPQTCKNGYFVDLEAEEPRQQLTDWTRDYNMSHGHMCPAGDNKWDRSAINQSFLLTNMCPQDEKLNGGGWQRLEEKCRSWANRFGEIYIVAGPIFHDSITRTLGEGRIAVPDAFFKVVLCLIGTPKAIGFVYKNDSSSQSIKNCACSIDDVEKLTGFDFFYSLTDEIENEIESQYNINNWK